MTKESSKEGGHKREHSNASSERHSGDDTFENFIFRGIAQGFLYITYYAAIGNYEAEDHLHNKLTCYPYYNGISGNYQNADPALSSFKNRRIDLENNLLYSNDQLFGNHLKFKFRPFQYFYFQTDYVQMVEHNTIDKEYSNLSLWGLNLCYDRIRLDRFNFGWTLGMNYIGNEVQMAGFSYGLNADVFIANNVSLYSSMKWSLINNKPVNEFEMQGKFHRKRCFFTIGYEHFKIASPSYHFISAGGGIFL